MKDLDIFNLDDVTDLPRSLQEELVINKRDDWEKRIIELFKLAKSPLSLDQIIVAYYRKYSLSIERRKMTAKLYNMCRSFKPAIESVEGRKGLYQFKEDFEN